ncbi:MAG: hypothetical protein ONB44_16635 [candidate division KSB1 bacterium]|nr:hypothetical protein [candidate division KSB1 bacterium]MDZ7303762.1 hypothetical protein [candidate division KSB1 bacterium]MDZ7313021.1 hypothetical protein [candidate division KSB1 bacterium]
MQSILISAAERRFELMLAVILSTLLGFTPFSVGQTTFYGATLNNQGVFMGGMGLATIDGETYYTINLRPEIALGKFGFGLDIPLRYNTQTGHIRSEDWNDNYDYFRAIRYMRYGRKHDKFYTRVGAIDAARLGHGFIMNYYNNSLLYDERKVGLELDTDFGFGGFELMTSNFGRREIFGGRIYYRPLQLVTQMPIIKNFTIGATYVLDDDPDSYRGTDDGITAFGFDAELPIVKTELARVALYGELAKINDYGSGQAAGVELNLRGLAGTFDFGAQLERRFLGEKFLPAYFGPFYELERHNVQNGVVTTKASWLAAQNKETHGTFGLLYGQVLNTLRIVGTYERRDGIPKSGILHIEADVPETIPKIAARAMYDDKNIETFGDAFEMDENSAARIGIGYKLHPFLIFYMDYIYTFRFDTKKNAYVVQKRFEPQLALAVTFPVGGRK